MSLSMRNALLTPALAANWMNFPVPMIVPSRAIANPREATVALDTHTDVPRLVRNRVFRLELVVATAIVGFGCFAWQTVGWENALRQTTMDQNQSLQMLTANLTHQDRKISDLTQSLDRANRDLGAHINMLSRQLQEQRNQMTAIDSRLRRIEAFVK